MQVLLSTKFGNLFGWWYDAGKADAYGNTNTPVIAQGADGPYCIVHA